jgi:hypothetical protein
MWGWVQRLGLPGGDWLQCSVYRRSCASEKCGCVGPNIGAMPHLEVRAIAPAQRGAKRSLLAAQSLQKSRRRPGASLDAPEGMDTGTTCLSLET